MQMTLFRSNNIEIYKRNDDTLAIVIYERPQLAKKLNNLLQRYPSDTKYAQDDEVLFLADLALLGRIGSILGLKL